MTLFSARKFYQFDNNTEYSPLVIEDLTESYSASHDLCVLRRHS